MERSVEPRRSSRLAASKSTTINSDLSLRSNPPMPTTGVAAIVKNKLPWDWQTLLTPEGGLLLGLDFGSTTCGMSYGLRTGRTTPTAIATHNLDFRGELLLETLVGLKVQKKPEANYGNWVQIFYGDGVVDGLATGEIKPENVFRNLKQSRPFAGDTTNPSASKRGAFLEKLHKDHEDILSRFAGYRSWVQHDDLSLEEDTGMLTSVSDVVQVLFSLLLLDMKHGLRVAAGLTAEELNDLFNPDIGLGEKLLVGVAVPEMWDKQRVKILELLIAAGWPENVEILSEAKCAAAQVLRNKVDHLINQHGRENATAAIMSYDKKCWVIADRGCHTLDISTMRIAVEDEIIRFKPLGVSTSTQHGADRANDAFCDFLPECFGNKYADVLNKVAQDGVTTSEFRFKQKFMRSFERAKRRSDTGRPSELQSIAYASNDPLPPGNNDRPRTSWGDRQLSLKKSDLRRCVRKPVHDILASEGPLREHLRKIAELIPEAESDIVLSGGGSLDDYLQQEVRRMLPDSCLETKGHSTQSFVAQGIILNLLDPHVCNDVRLAARSYGTAHCAEYDPNNPVHRSRRAEARDMENHMSEKDLTNRKELPDTMDWLAMRGARIRSCVQSIAMQQTIQIRNQVTQLGPFTMRVPIYTTVNSKIGAENGHKKTTEGIDKLCTWKIPLSKELTGRIARSMGDREQIHGFFECDREASGEQWWALEFDYMLQYRWAGMLQLLEVHIPYGVYFSGRPGPKTPCREVQSPW